jgi:hypothetical protein
MTRVGGQLPPEPRYQVPAGQVDAICEFVAGVPGAGAVLAEHISDNDEVLPYVLINDLARFYVNTVQDSGTGVARAVAAGLEFLAVSSRQDVRGLVTEFFDGLVAYAGEPEWTAIAALRPMIGPVVTDRLADVLNDYGVG